MKCSLYLFYDFIQIHIAEPRCTFSFFDDHADVHLSFSIFDEVCGQTRWERIGHLDRYEINHIQSCMDGCIGCADGGFGRHTYGFRGDGAE